MAPTPQEPQPRPLLLRIGAWASLVAGTGWILAALGAAFGIGDPLELRGKTDWEWWYVFSSTLLGGVALFAVGLGLQQQERWARPAVIAFWLGVGAFSIARGVLESVHTLKGWFDLGWLFSLALAYWYFYRKRNVVEYYQRLVQRPAA